MRPACRRGRTSRKTWWRETSASLRYACPSCLRVSAVVPAVSHLAASPRMPQLTALDMSGVLQSRLDAGRQVVGTEGSPVSSSSAVTHPVNSPRCRMLPCCLTAMSLQRLKVFVCWGFARRRDCAGCTCCCCLPTQQGWTGGRRRCVLRSCHRLMQAGCRTAHHGMPSDGA